MRADVNASKRIAFILSTKFKPKIKQSVKNYSKKDRRKNKIKIDCDLC